MSVKFALKFQAILPKKTAKILVVYYFATPCRFHCVYVYIALCLVSVFLHSTVRIEPASEMTVGLGVKLYSLTHCEN